MNQAARKPGTQPDVARGAYCWRGGELALWVEVLMLALKDSVMVEKPQKRVSKTGKVYRYKRGDNGRRLPVGYFSTPDCREIVMMIGPEGIKALRYCFTTKSNLPIEKKAKIFGIIDKLETYLK